MFKKKYTIAFRKSTLSSDEGIYIVSDTRLWETLQSLQNEYKFKIIFFETSEAPYRCLITIKCRKDEHLKIFGKYIDLLPKEICDIAI